MTLNDIVVLTYMGTGMIFIFYSLFVCMQENIERKLRIILGLILVSLGFLFLSGSVKVFTEYSVLWTKAVLVICIIILGLFTYLVRYLSKANLKSKSS